jgi:hypothetical protein
MPRPTPASHPTRIVWATLAFLLGFTALLVYVSYSYLFPAFEAARVADPAQRKQLAAHAWLLLAIILVILLAGLVLTFRFGRYFFPRAREPRRATTYVDAWAESGRRMQTPPPSDPAPPT